MTAPAAPSPDPDPSPPAAPGAATTVTLITFLHAFTHAFQVLLIPLYVTMQRDLNLRGASAVALIVTLYNVVYFLLSYGAGVLTDRVDRKLLLFLGLLGNSVAILLMGMTRQYEALLLLGVAAGVFGTLFHPAANALGSAHYPRSPGMMIGLIGIGAGIGFYVGPRFAGWRAEVAGWQRPLIEMGVAGVVTAVVFLLLARETRRNVAGRGVTAGTPAAGPHPPLGRALSRRVLAAACVLGWRDFASQAATTLASLYLQKAQGLDVRRAGAVLGTMMLSSIVINPLAVWASPRKRRLPALVGCLVVGGIVVALVPLVAAAWTVVVLALFQTCSLSSFALGDAAMLERVPQEVRGRVVGLFLSLAGTLGSTAPFVMGWWVDRMGATRAASPQAWVWPFLITGALMALAALSAPLIDRFGRPATCPDDETRAESMAMMAGEM